MAGYLWLERCGGLSAGRRCVAIRVVGAFWQPGLPCHYNNIFHSPGFGETALRDPRFLPHSVLDIWRYPLYWLLGGSPTQGIASPTNELFFGDARWVILTFGCMIFFAALCFSRRYRLKVFQDPSTGLFFSVIISYLVWMAEFSIQRYLAPVDILCGAAILFLFLQLPKAFLRLGGMLAVSVVCWLILKVPDFRALALAFLLAGDQSEASSVTPCLADISHRKAEFVCRRQFVQKCDLRRHFGRLRPARGSS